MAHVVDVMQAIPDGMNFIPLLDRIADEKSSDQSFGLLGSGKPALTSVSTVSS